MVTGVCEGLSIGSIIDLDRYPIMDAETSAYRDLLEQARAQYVELGIFSAPGFIRLNGVRAMTAELDALLPRARHQERIRPAGEHKEDQYGAYEIPERYIQRYATVAFQHFDTGSLVRRFYECDGLTAFIGGIFGEKSYF